MLLTMLHSKLHRATVTHSELHYEGSLGVDGAWMKKTGMKPGQQIDVLNITNGERFTTYLIEEPEGSKHIAVYGAAAHRAKVGELLILIAYAQMDEKQADSYKPVVLVFDENNDIVQEKHGNEIIHMDAEEIEEAKHG